MKELKIGRLSSQPELKEVTLESGEIKQVCNVTLFVRDPYAPKQNGYSASVPVRLTAWDDRARKLSECQKGEIITVIGTTAAVKHTDSDYYSYGIRVSSIYQNTAAFQLNKQMTALLNSLEKGEVSCIFDIDTPRIVEEVAQVPPQEEERENEERIDDLDKTLAGDEEFDVFDDFEEYV